MLTNNEFYTGLNNVLFASLDVGAVAVGFASIPVGAKLARIRVEAAAATKTAGTIAIRKRSDDVNPTNTVGFHLYADEVVDIRVGDLAKTKFISADANTQKINIEFYL